MATGCASFSCIAERSFFFRNTVPDRLRDKYQEERKKWQQTTGKKAS
jgi:hypothetical protein